MASRCLAFQLWLVAYLAIPTSGDARNACAVGIHAPLSFYQCQRTIKAVSRLDNSL
jgi:hypothetical protein